MSEHLADTNVGDIEYIRKDVALDVLKSQADTMRTWVERYAEQRRGILTAVNIIEDVELADVAPVVRCRDCEHYYFADNRIPQEQRYVCEISGEIWKPDSFCSYGEREE